MRIVNNFDVLDLNNHMKLGLIECISKNKVRGLNKFIFSFKVKQDFNYKGMNFKVNEIFQREY